MKISSRIDRSRSARAYSALAIEFALPRPSGRPRTISLPTRERMASAQACASEDRRSRFQRKTTVQTGRTHLLACTHRIKSSTELPKLDAPTALLGRLSVNIMLKLLNHELAVADDAIDEVADGDNSQQRSVIDDW